MICVVSCRLSFLSSRKVDKSRKIKASHPIFLYPLAPQIIRKYNENRQLLRKSRDLTEKKKGRDRFF